MKLFGESILLTGKLPVSDPSTVLAHVVENSIPGPWSRALVQCSVSCGSMTLCLPAYGFPGETSLNSPSYRSPQISGVPADRISGPFCLCLLLCPSC